MPTDIKWHMIGHLQTNKIKKLLTVPNLHTIETIDSIKLANAVNETCNDLGRIQQVFIEILTSDEGCIISYLTIAKTGIHVNKANELLEFILKKCPQLKLTGLMTMAKLHDRSSYAVQSTLSKQLMRTIRDEMAQKYSLGKLELSMGTSEDYEDAVTLYKL